jgi:hypothetical protein
LQHIAGRPEPAGHGIVAAAHRAVHIRLASCWRPNQGGPADRAFAPALSVKAPPEAVGKCPLKKTVCARHCCGDSPKWVQLNIRIRFKPPGRFQDNDLVDLSAVAHGQRKKPAGRGRETRRLA